MSRKPINPITELAPARSIAYSFLARRDYAAAELRQRLLRRGVVPETADAVLADLTELGYVDDKRFAKAWVTARGEGKGLGRHRLRQELRQKGIDPEQGETALAAYDPDAELATAIDLAARRLRQLPVPVGREEAAKTRHRIAQYLQRRGFDWETINAAIRQAEED